MLTMYRSSFLFYVVVLLFKKGSAQCPDRNGRFPSPGQCDAYIECIDGVPYERTCPQGLYFKENHPGYPCGYAIEVDCAGKATQPPRPTFECPNSFGIFFIGSPADCGVYMNCVYGKSYIQKCPEGLAFNELNYQCDWPDLVPTCDAEAYLGFSCPDQSYESYHNGGYCDRYFVCLSGKPRMLRCSKGEAFNPATNTCDDSINVPGC